MDQKKRRLVSGALALLLTGCAAKTPAERMDRTIPVKTATAAVNVLSTSGTYIGTVSAEGTANVAAAVSGTVTEVAVRTGDTVAPGQLLCRLDDESAQINLRNAQAGYRSAQISYEKAEQGYTGAAAGYGGENLRLLTDKVRSAQDHYDAMLELLEAGAVAEVEVEDARQSLASAQASLEAARASLKASRAGVTSAEAGVQSASVGVDSAQYQLSLYQVTAPISGVVEAVNVTENNFISSGNVAFVISNVSDKTVRFYVTDSVRQSICPGQNVAVAAGGKSFQGYVSEVSGIVDVKTGMFLVKALIENGAELPDGLSVSVTTVSSRVDNGVVIPCDALWFEDGKAYVYLAENGSAARREVELALYTSEYASLTAGIDEGDAVVTTWAPTLHDGAAIRVTEG